MSVHVRIAVADEMRPIALRTVKISRISNTFGDPEKVYDNDAVNTYEAEVLGTTSDYLKVKATFEHRYGDSQYVLVAKALEAVEAASKAVTDRREELRNQERDARTAAREAPRKPE
jgi:ethanolamine utilization microcompartment shell protein EutL